MSNKEFSEQDLKDIRLETYLRTLSGKINKGRYEVDAVKESVKASNMIGIDPEDPTRLIFTGKN